MTEKIFITGASSGIGAELARQYATPGATLGLVARRKEKLENLKKEIEAKGAKALLYSVDVCDEEKMKAAIADFNKSAGVATLVIANAGVGGGDNFLSGDTTGLNALVDTNVKGVFYTLLPFIPPMTKAGKGHLVIIGSIAGFRGLPGRGAYGGSKAMVKFFADGARPLLKQTGISITTIAPGFIESELTAKNRFKMPFLLKTEKAVKMMIQAIEKKKKTYVMPWQMRLLIPLIVRLPERFLPKP